MTVRVMTRICPQQPREMGEDVIVLTAGSEGKLLRPNLIKIPSPKNERETLSSQFGSVWGTEASQQDVFDSESR